MADKIMKKSVMIFIGVVVFLGAVFVVSAIQFDLGNKLFVAANGDVGIGTSSPKQRLDIYGRLNVENGVIQRGGSQISTTSDLGLYSQVSGAWVRFVSNNGPFKFYSNLDSGNGNGQSPLLVLNPNGNLDVLGVIKSSQGGIDLKLIEPNSFNGGDAGGYLIIGVSASSNCNNACAYHGLSCSDRVTVVGETINCGDTTRAQKAYCWCG